jgi:hypothetical protein
MLVDCCALAGAFAQASAKIRKDSSVVFTTRTLPPYSTDQDFGAAILVARLYTDGPRLNVELAILSPPSNRTSLNQRSSAKKMPREKAESVPEKPEQAKKFPH